MGSQVTGLIGPRLIGAACGARPGSGNCGSHVKPSKPAALTRHTALAARRSALGLPQFHTIEVNRRPSEIKL